MEVFPLDIKKMLIKMVSEEKSYNLRHLFCVNKMWRRLVSDYLINHIRKEKFEYHSCVFLNINLDALWEWPFFEMLSEQWKNTHLLASFIMYLDAIYNYNRVTTFRILHKKVCKLFLRDPFLRALKTMHDNLREVDIQNERIRILNTKLEKAVALKEASKKIFLELDEEWSHKKKK
jgi:hypothetical protein